MELTKQERNAIRGLKGFARTWPSSLWLFATGTQLCVMKKNDEGQHAVTGNGGVDPAYVAGSIDIESDGGDW